MKRKNIVSLLEAGKTGLAPVFLVLVLALVFQAAGCATFAGGKKLGSLTITGIPADYEGWTIQAKINGFGAAKGTITNGSAVLASVSGTPDESGAVVLSFNVDKGSRPGGIGISFEGLRFENEPVTVSWDKGVKTGVITITGIPDRYNNMGGEYDREGRLINRISTAVVYAGDDPQIGETQTGFDAYGSGEIVNGSLRALMWAFKPLKPGATVNEGFYTAYAENTVKKVILNIVRSSSKGDQPERERDENFVFDSVELTNGSAALDWNLAKKQSKGYP